MRLTIIIITAILFSTICFGQPIPGGGYQSPKVDSTQFVKLLSLKDLQIITQSLKDKMTVIEWEKVTQAIDQVYYKRREEYLKSKDTAKVKKPE